MGLIELVRIDPMAFVLVAVTLVFALSLHEYAHALAADLQGDRLPRAMGRLSLNPMRHLDPFGTLMILIAGFGWAKPVEFRPSALSSKRFGAAIVALAGPVTNLLLAIVAAFAFVALGEAGSIVRGDTLADFFTYFITINVFLAVFNLIPLPPLDGSRLLTIFLPPSKQNIIYFLDKYGFMILILIVLLGGFTILDPVIEWTLDLVLRIAGGG